VTILTRHPSPNFDARPAGTPVDMVVIHYTDMESAEDALARLRDPAAGVSAHYLIDEDGAVHQLVDEDMRAWHAGEARWRGRGDVNARSLGIELVNPGHQFGCRPFPDPQMAACIELIHSVLGRHPIPARNVVGHSDVAPRRKKDPGELFDWRGLAAEGIGLWPEASGGAEGGEIDQGGIAAMLSEVGYEIEDLALTVAAFQRHYRPALTDGVIDAETAARLRALIGLIAPP
jgi:N-acetylmuramoyl-L-alanine amidase